MCKIFSTQHETTRIHGGFKGPHSSVVGMYYLFSPMRMHYVATSFFSDLETRYARVMQPYCSSPFLEIPIYGRGKRDSNGWQG